MITSKLKVALLLSYTSIASISAAIITPALPHIEQSYRLNQGSLEWVVSIFLMGYVLGQLIYGPIANRFGRLPALRSGLIINLLGIVLCIIATHLPSYSLLLTGRLITALGAASGLSCTFMLINESLPSHWIKHAMAFVTVSFSVGIGLAVSIGGLVTQYLNWQDCFWILLVHGLLMLLLTSLFQETLTKPLTLKVANILANYLSALKSHQLVVFSLVVGLSAGLAYTYSAAAPIYAQTSLQLSPSQYGYWNLTSIVGMLLSGFLSAWLIKKWGVKQTLILGLSFMLPGLISLITLAITGHSNAAWFFITAMLLYLFAGVLFGPASYFASNAITDKASASAIMSFIGMGAATLSVVILGYLPLSAILSFTTVISVFFIVVVLLTLNYLVAARRIA